MLNMHGNYNVDERTSIITLKKILNGAVKLPATISSTLRVNTLVENEPAEGVYKGEAKPGG